MKGSVGPGRRPPALPICTRKMNLQMNSENKYVEREWRPLVTRKRAFMQAHCASKLELFKVLLLIILILTSIALPTLLYKAVAALLIPAGTWNRGRQTDGNESSRWSADLQWSRYSIIHGLYRRQRDFTTKLKRNIKRNNVVTSKSKGLREKFIVYWKLWQWGKIMKKIMEIKADPNRLTSPEVTHAWTWYLIRTLFCVIDHLRNDVIHSRYYSTPGPFPTIPGSDSMWTFRWIGRDGR